MALTPKRSTADGVTAVVHDGTLHPIPSALCGALHPERVFSHYAYGDRLPFYKRYVSDESDPAADSMSGGITIYVACQREAGHSGMHLAASNRGWTEDPSS